MEANQILEALRARAIAVRESLEKYDPRDSEGEELDLAQFFYAIYVPVAQHTVPHEFHVKRAETELPDGHHAQIQAFVQEHEHAALIVAYFQAALEFGRALYKDEKFAGDETVFDKVVAYQGMEAAYDALHEQIPLE